MADELLITADWRYDREPITVFRNPGQRERLKLLNDNHKAVRFVLTGKGEIFAGKAYEFLHGDAHTFLTHIYEANFVILGCLMPDSLSMRRFAESDVQSLFPMSDRNDLQQFEESDTIIEGVTQETYSFLMASKSFRRFIRGMRLPEPTLFLEPTHPDVLINPDQLPVGKWMVMLLDDGRVYAFPWVVGMHNLDYDPATASGGYLGIGGSVTVTEEAAVMAVQWAAGSHPADLAGDNLHMAKLIANGLVMTLTDDAKIGSIPKKREPR